MDEREDDVANADMPGRVAVLEAMQAETRRRLDRLEAKVDRLLFALFAAAIVILGAMSAGFWAVLAALAN